jgi:ERO1-like protein alpha
MKRFLGYILTPVAVLYYVTVFYYILPYKKVDLSGKIDDCCCEYNYLRDFNNEINPILHELTQTKFFRLYKVNLDSSCPFWAQTHLCKDP